MTAWRVFVLAALVVVWPAGAGEPRAAAGECTIPVAAPVSDGFRPPSEPWGPGNRGLTFATSPGVVVRAVAAGRVRFAGVVARHRYVTVELDDRRDVTYSFLAEVAVAEGDEVALGDPVGRTGTEPFHLGHRDAHGYLDPTPLVLAACGWHHAVLVEVPDAA